MKQKDKIKGSGYDFFSLALYTFAGLGIEMLLYFFIEPAIFHKTPQFFNTTENIIHWLITCTLWGITSACFVWYAKKEYKFDIFSKKDKMAVIDWIICFTLLVVAVVISYVSWGGFKVIKEIENNGWIKFIFQYIYYLFETVLVLLIVVFGQKAGEQWFKNDKIPWGGILVALTWGLIHMLTKGDIMVGLITALCGMLYGIVYLATKKNVWIAYPFTLLMFIL